MKIPTKLTVYILGAAIFSIKWAYDRPATGVNTGNTDVYIYQCEVAQHLRQSWGKEPTKDIQPEPYPSFRFCHKFSLMIVEPSMSGKSYFVKELLEKDHVHYEEPANVERYTGFMDSISIFLRI